MEENETNVEKTYTDPVTGKFIKGNPGGGRPLGSKDYLTLYHEAIEKIAKDNNTDADDMEGRLYRKGVAQAISGDYRFYKDILDRKHGTAQNNVNLQGELISKIISVDE